MTTATEVRMWLIAMPYITGWTLGEWSSHTKVERATPGSTNVTVPVTRVVFTLGI